MLATTRVPPPHLIKSASIGHLGDGAENTWLVGGVAAVFRLAHGHLHVCLTDEHRPDVEVHATRDGARADGSRGENLEGEGVRVFRPLYRGVDGADAETLVSFFWKSFAPRKFDRRGDDWCVRKKRRTKKIEPYIHFFEWQRAPFCRVRAEEEAISKITLSQKLPSTPLFL